jgi:hypothetical protein
MTPGEAEEVDTGQEGHENGGKYEAKDDRAAPYFVRHLTLRSDGCQNGVKCCVLRFLFSFKTAAAEMFLPSDCFQ